MKEAVYMKKSLQMKVYDGLLYLSAEGMDIYFMPYQQESEQGEVPPQDGEGYCTDTTTWD